MRRTALSSSMRRNVCSSRAAHDVRARARTCRCARRQHAERVARAASRRQHRARAPARRARARAVGVHRACKALSRRCSRGGGGGGGGCALAWPPSQRHTRAARAHPIFNRRTTTTSKAPRRARSLARWSPPMHGENFGTFNLLEGAREEDLVRTWREAVPRSVRRWHHVRRSAPTDADADAAKAPCGTRPSSQRLTTSPDPEPAAARMWFAAPLGIGVVRSSSHRVAFGREPNHVFRSSAPTTCRATWAPTRWASSRAETSPRQSLSAPNSPTLAMLAAATAEGLRRHVGRVLGRAGLRPRPSRALQPGSSRARTGAPGALPDGFARACLSCDARTDRRGRRSEGRRRRARQERARWRAPPPTARALHAYELLHDRGLHRARGSRHREAGDERYATASPGRARRRAAASLVRRRAARARAEQRRNTNRACERGDRVARARCRRYAPCRARVVSRSVIAHAGRIKLVYQARAHFSQYGRVRRRRLRAVRDDSRASGANVAPAPGRLGTGAVLRA